MLLTEAKIWNAKSRSKPYRLRDGDGLAVVVHPNGSKYWQFRYQVDGKERAPLSIGKFPQIDLDEARDQRWEAQKLLREGIDPNVEKRKRKLVARHCRSSDFNGIAKEWIEFKRKSVTDSHYKKTWRRIEMHMLPLLGKRPISEIEPLEVLAALREVESQGSTDLSRRLLQICGAIFRYAVQTGRLKHSPTTSLAGALVPHRTTSLPTLRAQEIPEFLNAFEKLSTSRQNQLAFHFLLLTAVRTGEMRHARWEEIDFCDREWRIPAEKMKMRRDHIVPLSRQVLEILEELQQLTGDREWLFPNQQMRVHEVMSEATILRMIERMGYKGRIVGHGFRSLFSTVLNEYGFNRDAIERQLAHVEGNKVRRAYNRAEYFDLRREMVQWWADYIDRASGIGCPAERDNQNGLGSSERVDTVTYVINVPGYRTSPNLCGSRVSTNFHPAEPGAPAHRDVPQHLR